MPGRLNAIFMLLFLALPSQAREVGGVTLPEQVQFAPQNTALHLNGAGIRTKFVFDIYVGALYLAKPAHSVQAIIGMPGPKRVHMQFLYDKVSKDKLVDGWHRGFKNNLAAAQQKKLAAQLKHFNSLFVSVRKGDVIDLDFRPGAGTEVWINRMLRGKVAGDAFYAALLLVWLGEDPADEDLKHAMLGLTNQE